MSHLQKSYSMQDLTRIAREFYFVHPSYVCTGVNAMKDEGHSHYSYVEFTLESMLEDKPNLTLSHDLLVEEVAAPEVILPVMLGDVVDLPDGQHVYQERSIAVASGIVMDLWNLPDADQLSFELEVEFAHA